MVKIIPLGSYVREEAEKGSDVDILVKFAKPVSLFTFLEVEDALSNALGLAVDLVPKHGLKPGIRDRVLSEAVAVCLLEGTKRFFRISYRASTVLKTHKGHGSAILS